MSIGVQDKNWFLIKLCLIIFFSIIIKSQAFSEHISKDKAEQIAVGFFNSKSLLKSTLKHSVVYTDDTSPAYYVFNFEGGGWAIIAANDVATPVLAYSLTGVVDENTLNPSVKLWLDDVKNQIVKASKNNLNEKILSQGWNSAFNNNFKVNNKSVAPLIKSKWNQTVFYNDSCPADQNAPYGYNGHVPAGCVAIAMAQIMNYYTFPEKGIGSNSYFHYKYGGLFADFGNTNYNWSNMPDYATSPNAKLIILDTKKSAPFIIDAK